MAKKILCVILSGVLFREELQGHLDATWYPLLPSALTGLSVAHRITAQWQVEANTSLSEMPERRGWRGWGVDPPSVELYKTIKGPSKPWEEGQKKVWSHLERSLKHTSSTWYESFQSDVSVIYAREKKGTHPNGQMSCEIKQMGFIYITMATDIFQVTLGTHKSRV